MKLCWILVFLSYIHASFAHGLQGADGDGPLNSKLQNGQQSAFMSLTPGKNEASRAMEEYLSRKTRTGSGKLGDSISCSLCERGIRLVRGLVRRRTPQKDIARAVVFFCTIFNIETRSVCNMIVNEYKEEVFFLAEKLVMEPEQVCGIFLSEPCGGKYYPGEMWNITFPDIPKPTPKPPTPPRPTAPKIRVLHLTDIHVDYQYKEGASVKCGEPLCCRDTSASRSQSKHSQTYSITKGDRAGKWGNYGQCDMPPRLYINLFEHLKSKSDHFDYVIFTGDIPAHDIWNQTREDQLNHVYFLDNLFNNYLPGKPVYWTIGNHEGVPVDNFPPPGIPGHSTDWLYHVLAKVWGKWLPKEALPEVERCGAFSVSPYPGFRIISFNSNYCNNKNLWLLLNATDPCETLQWLVGELQKAENNKEKVHILTHIPPGENACLKPWSYNYYQIVNRYESTIVNQFYGHNHEDWYQMFYDEETLQRPIGVGFVTPAGTSINRDNPTYRIYTIDGNYTGSSWAVLDYTGYYFNLTQANEEDKPEWKKSYSPKEAYDMKALYASDWEDLLQRMQRNSTLFQGFYQNYYNLYDHGRCDSNCKHGLVCSIKEGRSHDPRLCYIHK